MHLVEKQACLCLFECIYWLVLDCSDNEMVLAEPGATGTVTKVKAESGLV